MPPGPPGFLSLGRTREFLPAAALAFPLGWSRQAARASPEGAAAARVAGARRAGDVAPCDLPCRSEPAQDMQCAHGARRFLPLFDFLDFKIG